MPEGLSGGVLTAVVLVAMAVAGVSSTVHGIKKIVEKPPQVVTQPVRHPVKDAKAVGHVFRHL